MARYLLRLDDACPTMDQKKWSRMEKLLDDYGIMPLVGIVPLNVDPKLMVDKEDLTFWGKVHKWESKGWELALHGYNHSFKSDSSGINPFWNRSEYAGLPLKVQRKMIKEGLAVFEENNISPHYFFAPGHTFDKNTIIALRECSTIRIISDTIAFHPYIKDDFMFIPQIVGHCVEMVLPGIYTFCFHPNIMSERDFLDLEKFINKNKDLFITFSSINKSNLKRKTLFDKMLSFLFFLLRDIRGLRRKDDKRRMIEKNNNICVTNGKD